MRRLSVVAAVAAIAAVSCGTTGRELRPPRESPSGESGGVPAITQPSAAFRLVSPGLVTDDVRPDQLGDSYPATLAWSGVPSGTGELALAARSVSPVIGGQAGELLWLVVEIPPEADGYGPVRRPGRIVPNDRGVDWTAPDTGIVEIRAYALDEPLRLDGPTASDEILVRLEETSLAIAVLELRIGVGS